jgi:hypothetical protein
MKRSELDGSPSSYSDRTHGGEGPNRRRNGNHDQDCAPKRPAAPTQHAQQDMAPPSDEIAGAAPPGGFIPPTIVESDEFLAQCGQRIEDALDVRQWHDALDLMAADDRLERDLAEGLEQEDDLYKHIRRSLFPLIDKQENRPKDAGVYQAKAAQLRRAQATSLLNGGVEACDGTSVVHDTLPLTVTQIGVCMISYRGTAGAFGQRLYRRDLRLRGSDPLQEAFDLLSRRATRASASQPSRRDVLSELIRRGAMAYAERAFLAEMSNAPWRMGHGHPAPYELLTGSGSTDLLHMGLAVMRKLVDHKRFIFVPSDVSDRVMLSLGQALRPLEFMILERDDRRMRPIIEDGHLRGRHLEAAMSFFHDVAPKIVVGMYRTYRQAPPRVFYAHEDYAQQAALIAMADSVLQPQRSFPTLIDLADSVAGRLFGSEAFGATMQNAYSRRGHPLRFLGERETRE